MVRRHAPFILPITKMPEGLIKPATTALNYLFATSRISIQTPPKMRERAPERLLSAPAVIPKSLRKRRTLKRVRTTGVKYDDGHDYFCYR